MMAGYRDHVVSNDEIACTGCVSDGAASCITICRRLLFYLSAQSLTLLLSAVLCAA